MPEGGIGLDVERMDVVKHTGKILTGFREVERATLTPPVPGSDSVSVFRCEGCRAMNTDYSVFLLGACWRCGGHKLSGGSPTFWEREALIRRLDVPFFHWSYFKKYGLWGKDRSVGQALMDSLKRLPNTLLYQLVAPWQFHLSGAVSVVKMLFAKKGGAQ